MRTTTPQNDPPLELFLRPFSPCYLLTNLSSHAFRRELPIPIAIAKLHQGASKATGKPEAAGPTRLPCRSRPSASEEANLSTHLRLRSAFSGHQAVSLGRRRYIAFEDVACLWSLIWGWKISNVNHWNLSEILAIWIPFRSRHIFPLPTKKPPTP